MGTPLTMEGHPIVELTPVRQPQTPEQKAALAAISAYEDRYDFHTVAMPGVGGAKSFPESSLEIPVALIRKNLVRQLFEAEIERARRFPSDSADLCCG